ncbi:MAG: hypothetical protein ACE15B_03940 [Bryobacteraceae bacterium]
MVEPFAAELRRAIASGRYAEARALVRDLPARVPPEDLPQALELLAWARQAALCARAQTGEQMRALKPAPYAAPNPPRRRWEIIA